MFVQNKREFLKNIVVCLDCKMFQSYGTACGHATMTGFLQNYIGKKQSNSVGGWTPMYDIQATPSFPDGLFHAQWIL